MNGLNAGNDSGKGSHSGDGKGQMYGKRSKPCDAGDQDKGGEQKEYGNDC